MTRETTPAIHWREGPQQGAPFHAYVRSSKGSMLGMNFDSLCGQYWISTVKFGKPNAYPPAEVDRQRRAESFRERIAVRPADQ